MTRRKHDTTVKMRHDSMEKMRHDKEHEGAVQVPLVWNVCVINLFLIVLLSRYLL